MLILTGSGLGLFICRTLAQILGGNVGLYSVESVGSAFAYYIKAQRCNPPSDFNLSLSSAQSITACTDALLADKHKDNKLQHQTLPPVLSRKQSYVQEGGVEFPPSPRPKVKLARLSYRVLIVEDNLINQEVLRRQLTKEGCVTTCVNDGKQALDVIDQSTFTKDGGTAVIDIVLMVISLQNTLHLLLYLYQL